MRLDDVRVEIYRHFIDEGRPPTHVETAIALGIATHEAEDAYRQLAHAHVLVLAPGTPYIWMANPLSALPSPYRVTARGRDWNGICIWDAFGIVAMLGDSGTITTRCPDCGDEMTLVVEEDEVQESSYVVHYAVPARHWWDDIGFN